MSLDAVYTKLYDVRSGLSEGGRWRTAAIAFKLRIFFMVGAVLSMVYFLADTHAQTKLPSYVLTPFADKQNISTPEIEAFIAASRTILGPTRHGITDPTFISDTGETYHLPKGDLMFTEPLGKRVLILDVESRDLSGDGELLNPQLSWNNVTPFASGLLSHYLYAKLHGYDYEFRRVPDYKTRYGTWNKLPAIQEALETYDYVVFMDSDAMMVYPHLPLEWLLNYWQMGPEHLVVMAREPDEPQNKDSKGAIWYNSGFIVAQRSARTRELFERWIDCPAERDYHGCARFAYDFPHEQGAFGEYLFYDWLRPGDLLVLPCSEANGSPPVAHLHCVGELVRHLWADKDGRKSLLAESLVKYFVAGLHRSFIDGLAQHFTDWPGTYRDDDAPKQ